MAEVNLSKTIISSPIDGVVTARNVDVGRAIRIRNSGYAMRDAGCEDQGPAIKDS
jgi:multidrug resistance efflux pump